MINRKPMRRTGPIKAKPKSKPKPNPLKIDTRSAVKKGPARDKAHLARVREWGCLVCMARGPNEAHHTRTMGRRVSDYLTVPLCRAHHTKLHTMNEGDFWIVCNIRPREWIARFSPEGAAEIAKLGRYVRERT